MAAIPLACAAIAVPGGDGLVGFFVRKEAQGARPAADGRGPGRGRDEVLVVEDTVTTGGSTVAAIERIREQGLEIVGGVCVVDRLAGGARGDRRRDRRPVQAADDDRRDLPRAAGPLEAGGSRRFSRRMTRPSRNVQTWK